MGTLRQKYLLYGYMEPSGQGLGFRASDLREVWRSKVQGLKTLRF